MDNASQPTTNVKKKVIQFSMHAFAILILIFNSLLLFAQSNTHKSFTQIEKELEPLALKISAEYELERSIADSIFTKKLVQALHIKHSFDYPFNNLKNISILYAPDNSFRIITWKLMQEPWYCRQKGAIQVHTLDGSLSLFPLFDVSYFGNTIIDPPTDSVRDAKRWIGAVYYKILLNLYNNKKYYTLLGFDENSLHTSKKWVDILTFDEKGKPIFGANIFKYKPDKIKPPQPAYRFNIEYQKNAQCKLNYDEDLEMIVFDHLVYNTNDATFSNPKNLVPDGTYEGFQWFNGQWVHIKKLDNLILGNNNSPVESPLYDENGEVNQGKIDQQNKRNLKKAKQIQ